MTDNRNDPAWTLEIDFIEYAIEKPVAISVLACFYDRDLGDWCFKVLDPGEECHGYTHWAPLSWFRPFGVPMP